MRWHAIHAMNLPRLCSSDLIDDGPVGLSRRIQIDMWFWSRVYDPAVACSTRYLVLHECVLCMNADSFEGVRCVVWVGDDQRMSKLLHFAVKPFQTLQLLSYSLKRTVHVFVALLKEALLCPRQSSSQPLLCLRLQERSHHAWRPLL